VSARRPRERPTNRTLSGTELTSIGPRARPADSEAARELTELVEEASKGSSEAWTALIQRFDGVVRSIARRYRLSPVDVDDVSQTVWHQLVEHIHNLRHPRALPGWIVTTTSRHCLHEAARVKRCVALDPSLVDRTGHAVWQEPTATSSAVEEDLLRNEVRQVVQAALRVLSPRQQQLMLLVVAAEPPVPYAVISDRLGMPIGSIGPTRARCLDKLRRAEAIQAASAGRDGPRAAA